MKMDFNEYHTVVFSLEDGLKMDFTEYCGFSLEDVRKWILLIKYKLGVKVGSECGDGPRSGPTDRIQIPKHCRLLKLYLRDFA
jgi:hypothetical protein